MVLFGCLLIAFFPFPTRKKILGFRGAIRWVLKKYLYFSWKLCLMSILWRRRICLCQRIHKNFKNQEIANIDEQNTQIATQPHKQQCKQDKRRIGIKKSKSMAIYCFYIHEIIFAYRAIIRCALLLLHFFPCLSLHFCLILSLTRALLLFSFIHLFRAMNFLTLFFLNSDNCFLVVFLSLSLSFLRFAFDVIFLWLFVLWSLLHVWDFCHNMLRLRVRN